MQIPLVMTVIGQDRTGLVESVAHMVAEHGGNWLESRMCRLGGKFAGLLRVHVPAEQRASLENALSKLTGLTIVVHADESLPPAGKAHLASLEVVGQDRPGIVREISRALAARGVNVEELATECVSAPMSGEPLFQARAKLLLPGGVTVGDLQQSLEQAVTGLTVEVTLDALG
jgi:glycine cleavage system regulatory protein